MEKKQPYIEMDYKADDCLITGVNFNIREAAWEVKEQNPPLSWHRCWSTVVHIHPIKYGNGRKT